MRVVTLPAALLLLFIFSSCAKLKTNSIVAPGQTIFNFPYAVAPDTSDVLQSLTMDIYLPKNANSSHTYPLMLMIHGGGFNEGDKKDLSAYCSLLADSGFVAATISYRLGWRTGNNKCNGDTASEYDALYRGVQDASAALRFLVAHGKQFYIDTSRIFIGGGSAGGTIAIYTAFLPANVAKNLFPQSYAKLGALSSSGNSLIENYTIKGVLNMWGGIGDSLLINKNNALPMILFHGTADVASPYDTGHEYSCATLPKAFGSACIARQLARYQVPYILHLKQGATHAPAAYKAPFVMPLTIQFFREIMNHNWQRSSVITE